MRWLGSLQSKVVWRGYDAGSEMVMPNSVRRDASKQVSGSVLCIGDPLCQASAAIAGSSPTRWRVGLPMLLRLSVTHQNLKEARPGDALFLVRIATCQEVCFRVEMLEAASGCRGAESQGTLRSKPAPWSLSSPASSRAIPEHVCRVRSMCHPSQGTIR